jgi:hypothetical protein
MATIARRGEGGRAVALSSHLANPHSEVVDQIIALKLRDRSFYIDAFRE